MAPKNKLTPDEESVLLAIYTACITPNQFRMRQSGTDTNGLCEGDLYEACQFMGLDAPDVRAILVRLGLIPGSLIFRSAINPGQYDESRELRLTPVGAAVAGLLLARVGVTSATKAPHRAPAR